MRTVLAWEVVQLLQRGGLAKATFCECSLPSAPQVKNAVAGVHCPGTGGTPQDVWESLPWGTRLREAHGDTTHLGA